VIKIPQQIRYVKTEDFRVQKETSKAPMHFMHHHNSFEIFYIISGEREYFIEDDFFKMKAGDLVIVPENALHRTDGKGAFRFLINFSRTYLEKYLSESMIKSLPIYRPTVFRPTEEQKAHLLSLFKVLFARYSIEGGQIAAEDDPLVAGCFIEILFSIMNGINTYAPEDEIEGRCEEIVRYINENYASIASIEQIAEHFYISKYHLSHLFSASLGVGLISYLNTIKIRASAKMLESKKYSITEIATKCGFNSPSYFCKVFKREMGISPKDYKNDLPRI